MSQLMEELAGGGNGLSSLSQMLNLDDKELWKGALIGAAVVLPLTNKGVVTAWPRLQGGVEEIKERFQDAEAEIRAGEVASKE